MSYKSSTSKASNWISLNKTHVGFSSLLRRARSRNPDGAPTLRPMPVISTSCKPQLVEAAGRIDKVFFYHVFYHVDIMLISCCVLFILLLHLVVGCFIFIFVLHTNSTPCLMPKNISYLEPGLGSPPTSKNPRPVGSSACRSLRSHLPGRASVKPTRTKQQPP